MKGESKKSSVLDFFAVLFPLSAKKAGGKQVSGARVKLFSNKNIAFIVRLPLLCKDFQKVLRYDTESENLHAARGHD